MSDNYLCPHCLKPVECTAAGEYRCYECKCDLDVTTLEKAGSDIDELHPPYEVVCEECEKLRSDYNDAMSIIRSAWGEMYHGENEKAFSVLDDYIKLKEASDGK